jgi:hypothetical protein
MALLKQQPEREVFIILIIGNLKIAESINRYGKKVSLQVYLDLSRQRRDCDA